MSDPFSIFRHHGGNLSAAVAAVGRPREQWLDLSTGINPRPYPLPDIPPDTWTRLPETAELAALEQAARVAYDVADAARVVAAPGHPRRSSSGCRFCARAGGWASSAPPMGSTLPPGHGPGMRWKTLPTRRRPDDPDAPDVVVIVNPNNPDGRRHDLAALLALAKAQGARGGWLVVDEAFADVAPEVSVCGRAGDDGLVVLRSPGKFYGLAGLRLGFAIAAESVAERLSANLGPWAVAGPALVVGTRALADLPWRDATRRWLAAQAKALDAELNAAGLTVAGGTDLFRLVDTPKAGALFDRLARAGVLTRPFSYAARWLRLGLPGDAAGLERLREILK